MLSVAFRFIGKDQLMVGKVSLKADQDSNTRVASYSA